MAKRKRNIQMLNGIILRFKAGGKAQCSHTLTTTTLSTTFNLRIMLETIFLSYNTYMTFLINP
jgi:hypothetical protein